MCLTLLGMSSYLYIHIWMYLYRSRYETKVTWYIVFSKYCFFPDGLYHRMLTRSLRWSQECGGHDPKLFYRQARFFMDSEHDFIIEMAPIHLARIKVSSYQQWTINLETSDLLYIVTKYDINSHMEQDHKFISIKKKAFLC